MMMRLLAAATLLVYPTSAHATEAGIDTGWVVADGAIVDSFDAVDSLGVDWVRINFRLDAWSSPDDATPHGPDGLTWYQAYDRIVDRYLAHGIRVYGLLNDEAVSTSAAHDSDAWNAAFVQSAVQIVDHFKDRVRTWEVINEPNDVRFSASQFAKILQDTYLAVKHDAGHIDDRCWQVELVSGPLVSYDGNSSADYLAQAYAYGKAHLAWDYTHQVTGSYPLDGIGYHAYVAQGTDSSVGDVYTSMQQNLAATWNVVTQYEGAGTPKQVYLSEYGFRDNLVGDAGQADRLAMGFSALADFGHVALGVYFQLDDFTDNAWGVFDASGQRRPSADRLHEVADVHRPARWAVVENVVAPALRPGETGDVIVTLRNRGASAWSDPIRLGAAAGCPDATTTNAIEWAPTSGYANSVTDARVFLAADVPPGGSIDIHVPVRAPDQEGTYRFAARMVHEGVAWFGMTASAEVVVAQDAQGSGSDDPPAHHGGCATGNGAGLGVLLVLLRYRRPRWRPIAR